MRKKEKKEKKLKQKIFFINSIKFNFSRSTFCQILKRKKNETF